MSVAAKYAIDARMPNIGMFLRFAVCIALATGPGFGVSMRLGSMRDVRFLQNGKQLAIC
jgi:hypothetical protein